jgi:thiosulfate dehydrogenase [quinone] large subunit
MKKQKIILSNLQSVFLVLLRVVIGWHFLYEGIAKLYIPDWSSANYLTLSRWIFANAFQWMAANPTILKIVDLLNIWGLILIGLGLILGCFTRVASIAGAALLALYYISNPPFVGMDFGVPSEGNYLIVDKNLVEFFALIILAIFPSGTYWGLDRLLIRWKQKKQQYA